MSPRAVATDAARELARLARPLGAFDPARYFRADADVRFHGVPTPSIRAMARTIDTLYGAAWGLDGAIAFAEALIRSRYLDEKALGIELLARHRRAFTPKLVATCKRWLDDGAANNWATTDAICGSLIGPIAAARPALARRIARWAGHRSLWARRAAAVALIPAVRRGAALDEAYRVARRLHDDGEDLVQKAAGWLLREAGKVDAPRLEAYLRANGPSIPRTTVRYAIERMSPSKRRALLAATKPVL